MPDSSRTDAPTVTSADRRLVAEHPTSMALELVVHDPDTIAELTSLAAGDPREQFALSALRIGVLALRQARGQIDTEQIRRESERMLSGLDKQLSEHGRDVHTKMTSMLKEYFDPEDGRLQERVNRLIRKDGELEELLRRQIGGEDSELCKTLDSHFGHGSPLMNLLSPEESQGLLAAFRETFEKQLTTQRERVLNEFSLDNGEGALARLVKELNENHGKLSGDLQKKIDVVVGEFSLDEENSALSRLVRNVDRAQKTITSEFSLNDENSALSQLKTILDSTKDTINNNLTLDDEKSSLARLKGEILKVLETHSEANQKFREEVKLSLNEMVTRREEAARSTRHGLDFEDAVYTFLQQESQRTGDIASHTGNTTGLIKNCKVGDCMIELGPENAAAGAKIVVEAKQKKEYNVAKALEEIETARKNRAAQTGLFVFSKKSAPDGMEPFARYRNDVLVVWDPEQPDNDLYLKTGLTLARALCVRSGQHSEAKAADFQAIDVAVLEIEKRTGNLGKIESSAQSISKQSDTILKTVELSRRSIERQLEILRDKLGDLKRQEAAGENA
ncbi:hypothetical protein [Symmachiella dynata]|uniref:hypothetical protein n=1 Tax=Symmachiella dynata TaxID=2527995 RepID=UPI0030EC7F1F